MDGSAWAAIITALFLGSAALIASITASAVSIVNLIRAGHTAAIMADVKKNTDGMATAARETADIAAKAATDARDKDRASFERMTLVAPANGVPAVSGAPILSNAPGSKPARMTSPKRRARR